MPSFLEKLTQRTGPASSRDSNGREDSRFRRFLGVGTGSSSRSTSKSTSLAGPQPLVPATTSTPTAVQNLAFGLALKKHTDALSPGELHAFNTAANITPETLLKQIQTFDEAHRQESRLRECAPRIEGVLKILDRYLGPLAIFIGHSPEISSLVVGGVKLIVDLGLRFASFFGKLTEMMERLAGHLGYLTEYAESFIDSTKVQDALCDVYGDLLKFCSGARNVFTDEVGNQRRWTSFRIFLRVMWEPFESDFDAINVRFDDRVQIVIRTAGIVEHKRLRSKELLETQQKDDNERQRLLEWLSGLSGLNFDEDHDRIFKRRHGDTGNWLVESPEFKDWRDAKESCLLWCYGNPGVGKSVLTSLVVETISDRYALNDRIGIAFVYFNYQNQVTQKPTKILATLIKQLCRKKKVIPDHLRHFYKSYSRDAEVPSYEKLQAQLIELSRTFDQVFFVVDAMDELDSEDRKQFLPFVTTLAREPSCNLKVFVTSRREKDIEIAFTRGRGYLPTIQIEATKVDADIAAFVHFEIERRAGEDNLCVIDQTLQDRIEKTLVSQSNGMFLWVRYQLDYVYEQPSTQDIEDALSSLPQDMSDTYLRILTKIEKQTPAMRILAKRALLWVMTAARPLKLKELITAVAIEPTSRCLADMKKFSGKTVIDACGNFLIVESDIVRPVHYTVQEFLRAPRSLTDIQSPILLQQYQVFLEEAHVDLAHDCIQYMLFPQFESLGAINHDLSPYVIQFWDYHVLAPALMPYRLRDIFNKFLDTKQRNLETVYNLRHTHLMSNPEKINPLNFCLAFDILPIFQELHGFDMSMVSSPGYREALHYAARGGSVSAIQTLLDLGLTVHSRDANQTQPLYYAALGNHRLAMGLLLEKGAYVNAQGGPYGNALQAAAFKGCETVVHMLLENGADVNAQGGIYGNALQAAASGGHEAVAQVLMEKGADVNAQGGVYGNALQAAAFRDDGAVVPMLLEKGADVNAQGGVYGNALQAAACKANELVVHMLLEKGADINAQGGEYGNALQAAACKANELVVHMLLEKGADINAQGGEYGNALQAAVFRDDGAVVCILLERGADVNAQGGLYGNALRAAAVRGCETVAQILLENGADANTQCGGNDNTLHEAASGGHETLLGILMENVVDDYAQGGLCGSALQVAAFRGHGTMVQILLEGGADANAQCREHGSALHAAASNGLETVVQMLLEKGADVNSQGGLYGNALQAAAFGGHETVVQIFLDKGADINAEGGFHGSALKAAAEGGHDRVVKLLSATSG